MPVDNKKQAQQILALPDGLTTGQLVTTLNDRIDQINIAFSKFLQNPALGAADLGTFKIVNLADPKDDFDGVNLRTLRKFGAVATGDIPKGSGIENPTIYFEFDGIPFGGEASPFAIIMANRAGFTPVAVAAAAVGAPVTDCEVNLTIEGVDMLSANLHIPAGSTGPVFSSAFALPGSLPLGTLIQGTIPVAGGATQVTIALALRGRG